MMIKKISLMEMIKMEKEEIKFDATKKILNKLEIYDGYSNEKLNKSTHIIVTKEGSVYLNKGNTEIQVVNEGQLLDESEKEKLWEDAQHLLLMIKKYH